MERNNHYYHLPEDLVIDILLRMPVKSLLRFKSVCKNWCALVESPTFINSHFHHENNTTNLLIYWTGVMMCSSRQFIYSRSFTLFSDKTLDRCNVLDELKFPAPVRAICGPNSQGIFCVQIKYEKLALWNPATRRMTQLPTPKCFCHIIEFGFGADPLTNELKIVIIFLPYNLGDVRTRNREISFRLDFAVHTLGNDSWRVVENEAFLDRCDHTSIPKTCSYTLLNGFYYFQKLDSITDDPVIIAFDMHEEVFEEIEMPNIVSSTKDGLDLTIYNNSLALLSYNTCTFESDDRDIDIWVMKEKGSWTKVLTTAQPLEIKFTRGFWKKNMVFIYDHSMKLSLYDHDSNNIKNLKFGDMRFVPYYEVLVFSYKESLASVKGTHGLHDYDTRSIALQVFFA